MPSSTSQESAWLEPGTLAAYAELLASAVPRARGFALLGPAGETLWNGDVPSSELGMFARRLAAGRDRIDCPTEQEGADGSQNVLLPLTQRGTLIAWCVVSFADPEHAPGSLALIERLLAPALGVLSDSLAHRRTTGDAANAFTAMDRRLRTIYALDDAIIDTPHGQTGLAGLVAAVAKDLRIGYSVLLMPDKRIRFSVTHPSWGRVDRPTLDGVAARRLLPAISSRKTALMLDVARAPAELPQHNDGYQIIASPIREGGQRVVGVLAVVRSGRQPAVSFRRHGFCRSHCATYRTRD